MRVALLAAAVLAGCSAPAMDRPICSHDVNLELPAPYRADADVLLVLDRSPAMAPYQAHADSAIAQQAAAAVARNGPWIRSWHFGVVSADPADGAVVRWVDGDHVADLATLVHADDTTGSDVEPLETMYQVLHDPIAANGGFVRFDALLVVVFVSATDDAGTRDLSRYVSLLTLPAARGGVKLDPNDVAVASIAPTTVRLASVVDAIKYNVAVDVAASDWSPALRFFDPPIADQIAVPCVTHFFTHPTTIDCVATDKTEHPDGTLTQRVLPRCTPAATDCWQLVPDPRCAFFGDPPLRLDVVRTTDAPRRTTTLFDCAESCS